MLSKARTDFERRGADEESAANAKNLLLIIQLRWLAVVGQFVTMAVVHYLLHIDLPLSEMAFVATLLAGLNVASLLRFRSERPVASRELFLQLLLDVIGLTAQLHLSGGATNPFISLYLIQIILGAALLRPAAIWALVVVSSLCLLLLTRWFRPLEIHSHAADSLFPLHLQGMYLCFLLAAVLLVTLVTRINRNLADRDAKLAELQRQSDEEDHIVRLGLLASGAAHELGTPLSTLSVILNDWSRMPEVRGNPEWRAELEEMREEIGRCKDIVSGILLLSGQARGEDAGPTSLIAFLVEGVAEWRDSRSPSDFAFSNHIKSDLLIASDVVFKQMLHNVLDNAFEASPSWVRVEANNNENELSILVHDHGPGFTKEVLDDLGRPYKSTKGRPGGGLGLFLVVNVARKLGGEAFAHNDAGGGATIELRLPLSSLAVV